MSLWCCICPGSINKSQCCPSKQCTCSRLETPLQADVFHPFILLWPPCAGPNVFSRIAEYLIVSLRAPQILSLSAIAASRHRQNPFFGKLFFQMPQKLTMEILLCRPRPGFYKYLDSLFAGTNNKENLHKAFTISILLMIQMAIAFRCGIDICYGKAYFSLVVIFSHLSMMFLWVFSSLKSDFGVAKQFE